jgi:N-acetylglutamate synthase-like GNAT family acetyltransferase
MMNKSASPNSATQCRPDWQLRLARETDIPGLEVLIPLSARGLQINHYSREQIDAALGPIFGVDRQLIHDQTYFVIESKGQLIGCGGWSKRSSLFGSDSARAEADALLNPNTHPARIRAFFIHPSRSRQGLGRALVTACESAIIEAGFTRIELVATLPGEPLYFALGYAAIERFDIPMKNGLTLPAVKMTKQLSHSLPPDALNR